MEGQDEDEEGSFSVTNNHRPRGGDYAIGLLIVIMILKVNA